jgi:hypothetical protein
MIGSTTTPTAYSRLSIEDRLAYAEIMAQAGDMIPAGLWDPATGRPSKAKIFLVLETGAMLGLEAAASLQSIDVLDGRATIPPRLMLAFIRAAGHTVEITEHGTLDDGTLGATVRTVRADTGEEITRTFTIADAERAQLVRIIRDPRTTTVRLDADSRGDKLSPWVGYPQTMCVWRAAGRVGREGYEDLLLGIAWSAEELDAKVDVEGVRVVPDWVDDGALVERIHAVTDRAVMRKLYREEAVDHPERWTVRVAAAFDSHLLTLTYDSEAPKPGRPGHTGSEAVDALAPKPSDVARATKGPKA